MAIMRLKPMVALLVSGAMFVSSTGAVAAGNGASSAQQIDPWAALSVLSAGAPAAALCGAAATAAQAPSGCVLPATDAPPPVAQAGPPPPTPVPPVEPAGEGLGLGVSPLWLALGAIALGAAAYFLLRNKHKHATSPA
jgi:hypothetical protein